MVNPGEEYGFDEPLLKLQDFKTIFEILSKDKAIELIAQNYQAVSPTDIKLMSMLFKYSGYFILDESELTGLIKLAKKNLHIDKLIKAESMREVTYSLSIYLSLFTHYSSDYDLELQEVVIQWLIGNFTENFVSK